MSETLERSHVIKPTVSRPSYVLWLDDLNLDLVPIKEVPDLLGKLEAVRTMLLARLFGTAAADAPTATSQPGDEQSLLTIPDVAERLRMKPASVYELVRRGDLPSIRIGPRQVRISVAQLRLWIEARSRTSS